MAGLFRTTAGSANNGSRNDTTNKLSYHKKLQELLQRRQREQYDQWLSTEQGSILRQVNGNRAGSPNDMYQAMFDDVGRKQLDESLDLFYQLALERRKFNKERTMAHMDGAINIRASNSNHEDGVSIQLPFLESRTIASDYMTDLYYSHIREFFKLNDTNPLCCNILPTNRNDTNGNGDIVLVSCVATRFERMKHSLFKPPPFLVSLSVSCLFQNYSHFALLLLLV